MKYISFHKSYVTEDDISEVIVLIIPFTTTGEVIDYFNAKPFIADVDKGTLNIDVSKTEQRITNEKRVVITIRFASQPCNIDEFLDVVNKYGLFVISSRS
ncbi:MAG: DegT/DnrJ/EryC1/StrS family aminotransferase [Candidatus Scalinduaceae bacterium]